jgi:hypothetical protein
MFLRLLRIGLVAVLETGLMVASPHAEAVSAPLIAKPGKFSLPIRAGAVIGGQADQQFSLTAVESKQIGAAERITVTFGDITGKPLSGQPGFFHAVIDRESKRVVIDLAQVSKTRVDVAALKKTFAHSRLVASTDITMDPNDGSTNITLGLKAPAALLAATDPRNNGQVILELRPLGGAKK